MSFSETLERLVEEAYTEGTKKLDESLKSFAATMIDSLQEDWGDFELSNLTADADDAGEAAMWLDAVACTKKLASGKAHYADIELQGLAGGDVAAQVAELFESKKLPNKGLVYIAWSEVEGDDLSASDYSYVGYAPSHRKLNFKSTSKLGKAIKEATTLSLIVPKNSKGDDLEALASSIIHLTRAATNEDPTFNDDVDAAMPDSPAWKKLDQLSDMLEQAGVHLNNRARTGED